MKLDIIEFICYEFVGLIYVIGELINLNEFELRIVGTNYIN